ncbi:hypothetical protein [Pontibacter litorisediminis]|uniref:hypothetical protein n=1 Tax=Pontibacter litorisediminis TaxID=1846260 RepID=UPI0023EE19F4|nr:hypothetical protein [Pontibacter litorisediminis]
MRYLIGLLLSLALLAGCNVFKPRQEAKLLPLDSLSAMPYDTTLVLGERVSVRRLSPTQVLLSQPRQRQGKTKYKNVGNTELKQKDVGNVAIGKKAGQQQDMGNAEIKDVGNVEQKSQSYWFIAPVILLIIILFVLAFKFL